MHSLSHGNSSLSDDKSDKGRKDDEEGDDDESYTMGSSGEQSTKRKRNKPPRIITAETTRTPRSSGGNNAANASSPPMTSSSSYHLLGAAETIDLLKGLIVATCVYVMWHIDTSMMYHIIKSQSVIKLYLFYNMLEVGYFGLLAEECTYLPSKKLKSKKLGRGIIDYLV